MNSAKMISALALASMLLMAGVANAQTSTTTPGAPNTGAGGDSMSNILLLGVSAVAVLAGGAFLARKAPSSR